MPRHEPTLGLTLDRTAHVFRAISRTRRPEEKLAISRLYCQLVRDQWQSFFTDCFYPLPAARQACHDIFFGEEGREMPFRTLCEALFSAASAPQDHGRRLDQVLCQLLECELVYTETNPEHEIVAPAYHVLERLPATPPVLMEPLALTPELAALAEQYTAGPASASLRWQDLGIVRLVATNTICVALHFACRTGAHVSRVGISAVKELDVREYEQLWSCEDLRHYINVLAELAETAFRMADGAVEEKDVFTWFVVKAFLLSVWQRSVTLLCWYNLELQLKLGFDFFQTKEILLRDMRSIIPQRSSLAQKSDYMCTWAFRLLCNDRAAVTMDFRSFHQSFARRFGHRAARCNGGMPCDGKAPANCQRFVGAEIINQAQHDVLACSGNCGRLFWDEESYRSVEGARAVCIQTTRAPRIRYKTADAQTLAISHVWSHGQGGRPERILQSQHGDLGGMNACLHQRYVSLARSFGCDSYWMDTPCIPEDHDLRSESISRINSVFLQSKATVLCDRDLMDMDISAPTVAIQESILATILVCDWNVRSWTLLESLRGRRNLHVLCRNNATISLHSCLRAVASSGSISLAVLFLTSYHMFPPRRWENPGMYPARMVEDLVSDGFVSTEEAASLLSHRQASRPGDDLVIWSLLAGEQRYRTAQEMWERRLQSFQRTVDTGFLVSSVPRVEGVGGLGWAPRQPSCDHGQDGSYLVGGNTGLTRLARIRENSLWGEWGISRFKLDDVVRRYPLLSALLREREEGLDGFRLGALLQPLYRDEVRGKFTAVRYTGRPAGLVFGVCVSRDGKEWKWSGLYEWDVREALPEFDSEEILLV